MIKDLALWKNTLLLDLTPNVESDNIVHYTYEAVEAERVIYIQNYIHYQLHLSEHG